jgi:iron complex outermembrane recepter protein
MKHSSLPYGLLALIGVCIPVLTLAADSDDLETIVITGSRIPTIQTEGPSPVTVITAEDIQARGFTTIFDVTSSLTQNTGIGQTESFGGFTQNANQLNVRSLGPGRTLVLVDGRRMADYPLPYNSESNFVNISAIPAAAVERVEVLAGGASAVYGSDAVAGVVNIILKKSIDSPLDLNVRYGDTSQGGGQSLRAQGVGGFHSGNFSALYAIELYKRDPIFGFQRKFQDSVQDNPDPAGRINPRALLRADPFDVNDDGFDYIDPGASACAPFANFTYSFRPRRGNYCGQPDDSAQSTIRNNRKRGSLFTRASYAMEKTEIYGSLNYFKSDDSVDPNFSFFTTSALPSTYIFDVSQDSDGNPLSDPLLDPFGLGGNYALLQRFFQPGEIGGRSQRELTFKEEVIDFSVGVRGDINSNWRYDVTLSRSQYDLNRAQREILNDPLYNYFLGPQVGVDPIFGEFPAYSVRWDRFYAPITPTVWQQITAIDKTKAKSSTETLTAVMNGDLFNLPAGPVSSAFLLEYGRQDYSITLDPILIAGGFWGRQDTGGGGKRARAAAGAEFRVPLFEPLILKVAGRYDNYDDITAVNDAITYNAGLEYRPSNTFLLRGSYATSFRAPDMHQIFAGASGFFQTVTDEYLCRRDQPTVSLAACTIQSGGSVTGSRSGNPGLKEETSDSYTFGFVLQPAPELSLTIDYYNIALKGAVLDDSTSRLLEVEADCRLGSTKSGTQVDGNSAKCQAALARITRLPNNGSTQSEFLDTISTGPINTATINTSGIDAALHWAIPTDGFGKFDLEAGYSHVLKYDQQDFASDPVQNLRDDLQNFDWRSRASGSLTWSYGEFSTTAYVSHFGSVPNWAETGRISTFTTYNLSALYTGLLDGKAQVLVSVDNVFNKNPPRDPTFNSYPYYSEFNYSPVGREWFVQLGYKF